MRRTGVVISAFVIFAALALPALAVGPDWPVGPPPPHGHLLIVGDGQCVELAAGQVVPRNAQHEHLHIGDARDAQILAGHSVIPTLAFPNCAAWELAQN